MCLTDVPTKTGIFFIHLICTVSHQLYHLIVLLHVYYLTPYTFFVFACLFRLVSSYCSNNSLHSNSRCCKTRGSSHLMFVSRLTLNRYTHAHKHTHIMLLVAFHFPVLQLMTIFSVTSVGQDHGSPPAAQAVSAGWRFRWQLQTLPLPPRRSGSQTTRC